MEARTVKLIFLREVRDQLRDRRTLFMIVLLPVLLYPTLGLGLVQLTLNFGAQTRRIGIVGVDQIPASAPLLNAQRDRFNVELFRDPDSQANYVVIPRDDWSESDVMSGKIDALIIFASDAKRDYEEGGRLRLRVLHNGTDDDSELAYRVTLSLLETWEEDLVAARMRQLGRPDEFAQPLEIEEEDSDISPPAARSGTVWGKAVPFLLVMMALTGAFYPAVDLCAGEKERGTMETLLITPASRGEIVTGKFLAIFLFSVATSIFNLGSLGLTLGQISMLVPETARNAAEFTAPSLVAILWMLVLMLPLAAFFSAICMAISVFARSTKEGQYYLMPMFVIVMPLVFLTLVPGVELNFAYSLLPVTNVALLLRTLMLNQYEVAMTYLFLVLVPTLLYSVLALRFAIEQFNREEVLFREAERLDLGLWIRHLLRDKEATPTNAEAWSCFFLLLLLRWYSQGHLPSNLMAQAVYQLAFIGFPVVMMGMLLTSRPAISLGLRRPLLLPTLLAFGAVFSLHLVEKSFVPVLYRLFPIPDEVVVQLSVLLQGNSTLSKLIVFAVVPAICEELAFRGFILSGLERRHGPWMAILISSILFGAFHIVTPQVINATMLGVVLGIIVTRSGSIWPAIGFHMLHNGMMVLSSSGDGAEAAAGYSLPLVVLGSLASAMLIGYCATLPCRLPRHADAENQTAANAG
ncbi:ABC-2 family transporter protein [Planctomycetes bacterium Pan216]|uniref:ABC-2 family transporter protein n=1 Tax=Kolteria novifilia TaxID=2527975 RepID=A0A518B3R9_9BACT|nr:ABC-2 family transporter protein [Planctomycetes bacterium Pan216]